MMSIRFLLGVLAVLCVAATACAQTLKADGPGYYQPGEEVDGIWTIMPCRLSDAALQSPDALLDWAFKENRSVLEKDAQHALGSLIWQEADIAQLPGWNSLLTNTIHDCVKSGACEDRFKGKLVSKYWNWKEKGKDHPYKRYYVKKVGNTPPPALIAERYLQFGACSIPRSVDLGALLPDYISGDFPPAMCDYALDAGTGTAPRYQGILAQARGRNRNGKTISGLGRTHVCPITLRQPYYQIAGNVKPGQTLQAVASTALRTRQTQQVADRAARDKAIRDKAARERAAEPARVAQFKAEIIRKYGERSPRYLDPALCDEIYSFNQGRARFMRYDTRSYNPSNNWARIYARDRDWACRHIDPEAPDYTWYQNRQSAASRPSRPASPDIGQVISDGSAEWARQQAAKLECEKKYGFGNSVCQ